MPPALERRISESTPGAILQPQPPPWEKLVRRSGSLPGRAHSEAVSAVMAAVLERGVIVSARAGPCRQQAGDEGAHRVALARRTKERLARGALRAQARRERLVGG